MVGLHSDFGVELDARYQPASSPFCGAAFNGGSGCRIGDGCGGGAGALHQGAGFGVGEAGIEQEGRHFFLDLFDAALAGGFVGADAEHGLDRDGGDLLQQFAQMGAALRAAETFGRAFEEAFANGEARQAGEIGGDAGADRVGGVIHAGFGADHG